MLASAGLAHLGNRLELAEMLPGGGELPAPAGLVVAPLEVRVLRAVLRPTRQVVIAPYDRALPAPGHHERWRPEARILIEDVWPQIDGGRYPVKRIVGDEIAVWADLFRDGHDTIAAVLKYAYQDEAWREAPFSLFDNDRWVARFRADRVGRWRYAIEAWTDRFASWRDDLGKRREAGQDIALELVEGGRLVEAAIAHAAPEDAARLRKILDEFATAAAARRSELMLSAALGAVRLWGVGMRTG